MRLSKTSKRPYFLWDYDLTEDDVRRILHGKNEVEKIWMMGRILSNASYNDIWKYLRLKEVVEWFPKLRMRKSIYEAWKHALTVWGYHV